MNWGVELLQSSALPLGYGTGWSRTLQKIGASDEARTRYLHLGKVALYQMSYTRNSRVYNSRFSPRCQYFFIFSLPQSHGLWVDRDQAASPHWGTRSLRQEYPAPVSSPSVQKRRSPSWVRST